MGSDPISSRGAKTGSDPISSRGELAAIRVRVADARLTGVGLAAAISLAMTSIAHADDALEARVNRERDADTPGLVLDTIVLSNLHVRVTREHDVDKSELDPAAGGLSRLEGLTAHTDRTATTVSIGRTDIVLEGIVSKNGDTPERPAEDLVTRGWRTGIRVGRDVGGIRLEAGAALGHDEMPILEFQNRLTPGEERASLGSGTFYELGVSATKRFKLAHHDAWLSLTAGRRVWLGDNPPAGEPNEVFQLMLRFGFTF